MSDFSQSPNSPEAFNDALTQPWSPSPRCHTWLLYGALAVLVLAALETASAVMALKFWEVDQFTIADALTLAGFLPDLVVLLTFLILAREIESRAIWKSAMGLFLCNWLLNLLTIFGSADVFGEATAVAATIGAAAAIVGILIFLWSGIPYFVDARSKSPTAKKPRSKKKDSEIGCGTMVAIYVLFKVVTQITRRGRWNIPQEGWLLIEMGIAVLLFLCLTLWLAMALFRQQDRLGFMAVILAGAKILSALCILALAAFFIYQFISLADNPNVKEEDVDKYFDLWARRGLMIFTVSQFTVSLLTAVFFVAVRSRSASDWRFEFSSLPPHS